MEVNQMELYIVIGLLGIVIALIIIVLTRNNGEANITERLGKLETNMVKEIGDFKSDFAKNLGDDFDKFNEKIEKRLLLINDKVNEKLDENFQKANKTFSDVLVRLAKIDEAQKKIDGLGAEIVSLQSVLTDKKTRGIFGEVNLELILKSVFGEEQSVYKTQVKLSNNAMVDAVLYAPAPLGTICIDSKFPLENYERMTDRNLSKPERDLAIKAFKSDVKNHIKAISEKYIITGETTDQAILFLPAEAIFAEINAYHHDLLQDAFAKRVWITGPTTLMSTLTMIQMILKNMERDKYAQVIHDELAKLSDEFNKYRDRWDKLSRSIDTVNKDVKDIHVTTEKISKRFDSINNVKEIKKEDKKKELQEV